MTTANGRVRKQVAGGFTLIATNTPSGGSESDITVTSNLATMGAALDAFKVYVQGLGAGAPSGANLSVQLT